MPKRQMLVNYVRGEECRIAIVEDGRLEELYQERASAESHVGNIYKGRVANVEASIQAAFVDFGLDRHGFLHITDLHPMYFRGDQKEDSERVGHKTPRHERPLIQKCLRRGQEVLVQVLKEGIGSKGPTLTSYLSIPGRFLVMMPYMERLGVSRKVEDDDARRAMRRMLDDLKPPRDFGFIVRTAGVGRTKTDLKRDLAYLQRLWKRMSEKQEETDGVGELYTESDLIIRTIRDVFSSDIDQIIVDDEDAAKRAAEFLAIANPRTGSSLMVYRDPVPLFDRYDLERQIETINSREVPLVSGGSLVIEQTEALVAIDVNSGKSRDARDAETNAYKTNVEACDEICRQLRLRDLGGVIINDLIDMRMLKHRRSIEQQFRQNLKKDRARTRIGPISSFGILEMTRQRMRPSLKKSIYTDCAACQGTGHVKSTESVVLHVMRQLALVMHRQEVAKVELTISPDVAFQLLNRKRQQLVRLEQTYHASVLVRVNSHGSVDTLHIAAFDERGGVVDTRSRLVSGKPQLVPVAQLLKEQGGGEKSSGHRRRRRRKPSGSDAPAVNRTKDASRGGEEQEAAPKPLSPARLDDHDTVEGRGKVDHVGAEKSESSQAPDEGKKSKRSRRRRGGRRRGKSGSGNDGTSAAAKDGTGADSPASASGDVGPSQKTKMSAGQKPSSPQVSRGYRNRRVEGKDQAPSSPVSKS